MRQEMIAQTSAFLSLALSDGRMGPRIPRRRVDEGGFSDLLRRPGARAVVGRWWERVLERLNT